MKPARIANALRRTVRKAVARRRFAQQFGTFTRLGAALPRRFEMKWRERFPCLSDATPSAEFDRHYVYHTAWAARVLAVTRPSSHVDISSSLYFCSIVSAFLPITFLDFRPAALKLSALTTGRADLMKLPFESGTQDSLSCMHVVEHIGLGRYGDVLDPNGDLKAIAELQRVLAPMGTLLFVVPIGQPVIRFNAHRIYAFRQIVDAFAELELVSWTLIPDRGNDPGPIENASEEVANEQEYACGCFQFTKPLRRCV